MYNNNIEADERLNKTVCIRDRHTERENKYVKDRILMITIVTNHNVLIAGESDGASAPFWIGVWIG